MKKDDVRGLVADASQGNKSPLAPPAARTKEITLHHQPAKSRALPVPGRAFSDPAPSPFKELNQ